MPSQAAVLLPEVLPPAATAEVAEVGTQAAQTLAVVEALVVDGPKGEQEATEWLGYVAQAVKKAEEVRLSIVQEPTRWVDNWNTRFRNLVAPYKKARKALEDKLGTYRQAVRWEQARVQRELEAAEQARQAAQEAVLDTFGGAANPEAAQAEEKAVVAVAEAQAAALDVPEVAAVLRGSMGTAVSSLPWTFEIEKPDDVPRSFCMPDEKRIREAVKVGVRDIAGVRIFQK
ncbi:MAG: hypothetical protein V2A77_10035, partial [Pseudomonadota bacterium]